MAIEKVETEADQDIFRSAMSDEPQEQPLAEPEAQPRDDLGRYAPKQAEEPPAAATQQQPVVEQPTQEDGNVPSWRLREIREERDNLRNRIQDTDLRYERLNQQFQDLQRQWQSQQKPKEEPVDWFQNPDAALQQQLHPLQNGMEQLASRLVLRASKAEAMAEHGAATVREMEAAIGEAMQKGHPDMQGLSVAMRNSDDPVGVAMSWYQREKLQQETGGNLSAYKEKLQNDLLKDPAFLAKALDAARGQANAQPGGKPIVQIPPSLNKAAGGAGNIETGAGDLSNESLWDFAKPQRGR